MVEAGAVMLESFLVVWEAGRQKWVDFVALLPVTVRGIEIKGSNLFHSGSCVSKVSCERFRVVVCSLGRIPMEDNKLSIFSSPPRLKAAVMAVNCLSGP